MNAEQARAILAQGRKDNSYESPIPDEDDKAISEAEALIEMAQTAWDQHVRGPEVEALLRLSNEDFGGDAKEEEPKKAPREEPKFDPVKQKVEEPEPEPESSEDSSEEKTDDEGEDLSQIEPWEGYDKEKVSDVLAGINHAVREYDENDLTDLMANVWAYEKAHKERSTILSHLEDVAERLQSGEDPPPDPDDSTDDSPVGDDDTEEIVEATPEHEEKDAPPKDDVPTPDEAPEGDDSEAEGQPEEERQPEPEPDAPGEDQREDLSKEEPEEAPKPKRGRPKKKQETPPENKQEDQQEDQRGSGDDPDDYSRMQREVDDEIQKERLHKPKPPEEDIPDLPWDWTKMSNAELQRFHGIYSALAYHKNYLLVKDERMALHCKAAADDLHNSLLVFAEKYDDNGKQKTMTLLEAEIESDENIKAWRRRQRKHETFATSHRNERDSLAKLVEALSRHEAMRDGDWQRSGGKVGRSRG